MRTRPAFGRCDCARSDRGWEVADGYTSEASHVRRSPTPDGGSLLGDVSQLCHGFFHLSPTPELASHPHELCLRLGDNKCETKGVVVVAALRDRAGDVKFLARYSNCPLSSHAEEYAIRDEELIRAVKDLAPDAAPIDAQSNPPPPGSAGTLTLYQRLQPCHGSSDNKGPRWSCSEALINGLHRELLEPRGISLRVAVSYTYRAHWDVRGFDSERNARRYAPAVQSAREGIRLFAEAAEYGATLNALDADDWAFLVSLCDDDVAADHASAFGYTRAAAGTSTGGSTSTSGGDDDGSRSNADGSRLNAFTPAAVAHRAAMDAFVASEIRKHSEVKTGGGVKELGERMGSVMSLGAGADGGGGEPRTFAEKMRLKRQTAAANK